ncbi:MAG: heterodisulfide reductase [Firmicutes bacterium]|nr:heterodisulfide reductase [Bacillota bacterium]
MKLSREVIATEDKRKLQDISGEEVLSCYQCGKCSAGCAMTEAMDLLPHQVIRLLQLGQVEEALHSRTIWVCASCLACSARCPRGMNLPNVMESLRAQVLRPGDRSLNPADIPYELLEIIPEQALVAAFRKYT